MTLKLMSLSDEELSQAYNCLPIANQFHFPPHPTSRIATRKGRMEFKITIIQTNLNTKIQPSGLRSQIFIFHWRILQNLIKIQKTYTCLCWTKEERENAKNH